MNAQIPLEVAIHVARQTDAGRRDEAIDTDWFMFG